VLCGFGILDFDDDKPRVSDRSQGSAIAKFRSGGQIVEKVGRLQVKLLAALF
jgi:hypothetical protein